MSTPSTAANKEKIDYMAGLSDPVAKLKDPDRMEREEAAFSLTSNPDPEKAAELCKLLYDSDISVRNLVAEVLVKMGETAVGALIAEASSPDHDVRKFVVDIMALINDQKFIPVLINLLNDRNENVVGSAAEALGNIVSSDAVDPLIECIKTHPDSSPQAIEALGKIGSARALPVLFELLDSDNIILEYAAVEAIGKTRSPQAINKLLDLLRGGNPELRNVVLTTILKLAGTGNRDSIFQATGGKFANYLVKAAASDDLDVKIAVLSEMAFWTGDEVVAALIQVLDCPDQEVVDLAQGALRVAGNSGLNEMISALKSSPDPIKMQLIEISSFLKSPELFDSILAQAESVNSDIRIAVAKTLAKFSDRRAVDVLLKLAEDEVGHVRAEALRTLAIVGGESEIEQIGKHLNDEYGDVREASLGALILISGPKTIELFKKEIQQPDINRKVMAVRGLGWIGEETTSEILLEALTNEEAEVRRHAIIGLSKMRYEHLDDNLTLMLADENPEVRKAVIDAYLSFGRADVGEKIKVLLDDEDMWVRFYAINALISIDDRTCLDKLIGILYDQPPFVQIAIIGLMAKYDDPRAKAELLKLVKHDNEDISNAAREALETK